MSSGIPMVTGGYFLGIAVPLKFRDFYLTRRLRNSITSRLNSGASPIYS